MYDQPLGTEPIILLEVDWTSGTGLYSERPYLGFDNRIMSLSGLAHNSREGYLSSVSSISVTLNDTDASIKTQYNTTALNRIEARVYIIFVGQDLVDRKLLMKGFLSSNLEWSEPNRTVTLNIDSHTHSDEVPWPMVFGNVKNVPGRVDEYLTATTKNPYQVTATELDINNGKEFPQETLMTIAVSVEGHYTIAGQRRPVVHPLLFEGEFDGDIFTVSDGNLANYSELALAARQTDADFLNPNVIWIADPDVDLVGLFCFIQHPVFSGIKMVNYCIRQEGGKCWFARPWQEHIASLPAAYPPSRLLPDSGMLSLWEIGEAMTNVPSRWDATYQEFIINSNTSNDTGDTVILSLEIVPDAFVMPTGSLVRDAENLEYVVIVNQAPSYSVPRVMAWRKASPDADPTLEIVPSSYYTVDLVGPTTVTFERPLSLRPREGWSDEIFASVRSTLSRNTATAIGWVLDNYTDATPNTDSFTATATLITNYHSNFATLDDRDAMDLVNDMAFQARCALRFDVEVYIVYLSQDIASLFDMDETNIAYKTLSATFTDQGQLATRHVITWTDDYAFDDKEYIFDQNINQYGLIENSRDFKIYTDQQMVKYSAGFWGVRLANLWRLAKFTGFIESSLLKVFNTIGLDVGIYGSDVRGTLLDTQHDLAEHNIAMTLELASRPGSMAECNNYWLGDPDNLIDPSNPAPPDPTEGMSPFDYVVDKWPVETQTDRQAQDTGSRYSVSCNTATTLIRRGQNFTLTVLMLDSNGNPPSSDQTFDLQLFGGHPSDVLSVTNITLVSGYWQGSINVNGGSGAAAVSIRVNPYAFNIVVVPTDPITIDLIGAAEFVNLPVTIVRGTSFNLSVTNGFPSGIYDLALITTSDDEIDPLTITVNSSGEGTVSCTIEGDDTPIEYVQILLTRSTYTYTSETISLLAPSGGGGGGRNQAFVCKVGTKVSGNQYNVTIYPEYNWPSASTEWSAVALQLQGNTTKTIPLNTFTIAAGILVDGGDPDDPTDYRFYMQVPIWL